MKSDLSIHNISGRNLPYGYIRPSDWLTLPEVFEGEQKVIALFAIFNDVTISSFSISQSYTIDWGDGTVQNYSGYSSASHSYTYNSLPSESYCSRGYKQVIITITPQSGKNLEIVDFPSNKLALDINVAGSNISYLRYFGGKFLERFNFVGTNNISSTNFTQAFYQCWSLQSIPNLDTSKITNFSSLFQYCYSLQTIPLLNTSNGTNFSNMFDSCYSLKNIPLLDTSSGTAFSSMFSNCYSLQTIPLLNTSNGTNFGSMFNNCYSLQTIPLLNTSNGTNFGSMFYGCFSLLNIPQLNTSKGSSFGYMFYNCYSLKNVPLIDTSSSIYSNSISSMFYSCYSLQAIPALDVSKVTDFSMIFYNCSSLIKCSIYGTKVSISYSSCSLSKQALVDIFNGLASGVSGQTITISSNPGASLLTAEERAIATNKGWTISG